MSCVMSYNFFDKLLASTLFPLVLAAIILGLGKLSSLLRRDPADQRAAWIYAYSWFLLLTYVVFTGASTTVLRFFNCVEYESRDATGSLETLRVLQADHSISCDSPSYDAWKGYAVIMVFIYPIGIPLLYLCELLYHRKAINPDIDADRVAAPGRTRSSARRWRYATETRLSGTCTSCSRSTNRGATSSRSTSRECYLFIRRPSCSRACSSSSPGSHTQITVGLLLAFLSYSVMMDFSPCVEDVDDRLADVGQSQIVFVFIASLVLHAKDMPEQEGAPGSLFKGPLFAAVMVVIGTMTLLMTIYMLVAEYCGIGSPKDAQAAASSVSGGRPSRNRERATANLAKLRGAARATAAFARAGGESSGADDELESPGARMYRRQYRRTVAAAEDLSHMSISQLKRVAPERRVDVSGCLDKADIEALDVPEPRTRRRQEKGRRAGRGASSAGANNATETCRPWSSGRFGGPKDAGAS